MVFVIMTIWEGTEKGHHRVYVLRQHRYGKPLWNVVEHPPPRPVKKAVLEWAFKAVVSALASGVEASPSMAVVKFGGSN